MLDLAASRLYSTQASGVPFMAKDSANHTERGSSEDLKA